MTLTAIVNMRRIVYTMKDCLLRCQAVLLLLVLGMCTCMAEDTKTAYILVNMENNTAEYRFDSESGSISPIKGVVYPITGDNPLGPLAHPNADRVRKIVVDRSFSEYRPVSMKGLFSDMLTLESIEGLSNVNTSEVIDMTEMFARCPNLKSLDLSSFDMRKVKTAEWMFANCMCLQTVIVGEGWQFAPDARTLMMFCNCQALKGGAGTEYSKDLEQNDVKYNTIDGLDGRRGLLTYKGRYMAYGDGRLTSYDDDKLGSHSDASLGWPDGITAAGQSIDVPTSIGSESDWDALSGAVAKGLCPKGTVRLTADITVRMPIGDSAHPFRASCFDGCGHTLTFNYAIDGGEYCAPFGCVSGDVEFRNLKVTGRLTDTDLRVGYFGGFVGRADGDVRFTNCASLPFDCSSFMDVSPGGIDTFGGFVGLLSGSGSKASFKGCAFYGAMAGHAREGSGFVGKCDGSVSVDSCLSRLSDRRQHGKAPFADIPADRLTLSGKNYYCGAWDVKQGLFSFDHVQSDVECELDPASAVDVCGQKVWTSGAWVTINCSVNDFDHWEGNDGKLFISNPWKKDGRHQLRDIVDGMQPSLTKAQDKGTSVGYTQKVGGVKYKYLEKVDYHLYLSDEECRARGYYFSDKVGNELICKKGGDVCRVTAVIGCDADGDVTLLEDLRNNDILKPLPHTHLAVIAPYALKNMHGRVKFADSDSFFCNAVMEFGFTVSDYAFYDSSGMYLDLTWFDSEGADNQEWFSADKEIALSPLAFEGCSDDYRIAVHHTKLEEFMNSTQWEPFKGHLVMWEPEDSEIKDPKGIGSYSLIPDDDGYGHLAITEDGNNHVVGMMQTWHAEFGQSNPADVLDNPDAGRRGIYITLSEVNAKRLADNDGVLEIASGLNREHSGSYQNYKTIAVGSEALANCTALKEICFGDYTHDESDRPTTGLLLRNGSLRGCDSLRVISMYHKVCDEDGDVKSIEMLGPKDVIPGTDIFGIKDGGVIPGDLRIEVSPSRYQEFLDDPNWGIYAEYISPSDYAPSKEKDIEKDGLSYVSASKSLNIQPVSTVINQKMSWWNVPIKIAEVIMLYSSIKDCIEKNTEQKMWREAVAAFGNDGAYGDSPETCQIILEFNRNQYNSTKDMFSNVIEAVDKNTINDPINASINEFLSRNPNQYFMINQYTSQEKLNILFDCGFLSNNAQRNSINWLIDNGGEFLRQLNEHPDAWRTIKQMMSDALNLMYNDQIRTPMMALRRYYFVAGFSKMMPYLRCTQAFFYGATIGHLFPSYQATGNDMTQEQFVRGSVSNLLHQASNVSYENTMLYMPKKKLMYHVYVGKVSKDSKDVTIYNNIDNHRTVAIGRNSFRGNRSVETVKFAHGSGEQIPMLIAIPDSSFAGCTSLREFRLTYKTDKSGEKGLGPENFILGGDSVFAGCDSTKLCIVIDEDRRDDFLNDPVWSHYKRYFRFIHLEPHVAYKDFGVCYDYFYDGGCRRVTDVSGHTVDHLTAVKADEGYLKDHSGAMGLCNDIGIYNNYKLDLVAKKAFAGCSAVRNVHHWDLKGWAWTGDTYYGLEFAMGDSCFINCPNLESYDLVECVTDGVPNHLEPLTPQRIRAGKGMFDGSPCRLKMTPEQTVLFGNDPAWSEYRDRFMPCLVNFSDLAVRHVFTDMNYHVSTEWDRQDDWEDFTDLDRVRKKGFNWLDGKLSGRKDLVGFNEFRYFASVGLKYVGDRWFKDCSGMKSIMLPDSVLTIGSEAFSGCSSLVGIELPASVDNIKDRAFSGCSKLAAILVRGATPASLGSVAFPKNGGMKIYVPAQSLADYLEKWHEYRQYIVSDAETARRKYVRVDKEGELGKKLGISMSSEVRTGADDQKFEVNMMNGFYAYYDSLTVSGPLNKNDIRVLCFLAGRDTKTDAPTDGRLGYLDLSDATTDGNTVDGHMFDGCSSLHTLILPKTTTKICKNAFESCTGLRRLCIRGRKPKLEWDLLKGVPNPVELVFLTDEAATSSDKKCFLPWNSNNPWRYSPGFSAVFVPKSQRDGYYSDTNLTNATSLMLSPVADDEVLSALADSRCFFPDMFPEMTSVEGVFKGNDKISRFKEFASLFTNVCALEETFSGCSGLQILTIPDSVREIGYNAFGGCTSLDTIYVTSDSVAVMAEHALRDLPESFRIIVPARLIGKYCAQWPEYREHIAGGIVPDEEGGIITVTVTKPNTLHEALGLKMSFDDIEFIGTCNAPTSLKGDYSCIKRLKVIGPISGGDIALLRHLAGYCMWLRQPNPAGQLEYLDLYDAQIRKSNYCYQKTEKGKVSAFQALDSRYENHCIDKNNELGEFAFSDCSSLRTLILPRTCTKIHFKALQKCANLESVVLGDDTEHISFDAFNMDVALRRLVFLYDGVVDLDMESGGVGTLWSNGFFNNSGLFAHFEPTVDGLFVPPSLVDRYLNDKQYTNSDHRVNMVSAGEVTAEDDAFRAFASHNIVAPEEYMQVTDVRGWFKGRENIKDLTCLALTSVDSLAADDMKELTSLERIAMPKTLTGIGEGAFKGAEGLRYADFLMCDSTLAGKMRDGGLMRIGITENTLSYMPEGYGSTGEVNVVYVSDSTLCCDHFKLVGGRRYCVPYGFWARHCSTTIYAPTDGSLFSACLPYSVMLDGNLRAYQVTNVKRDKVDYEQVKDDRTEALQPYLFTCNGGENPLETDFEQAIPASRGAYGRQVDMDGYSFRGMLWEIGGDEAYDMGVQVVDSDGTLLRVRYDIEPFSCFIIPNGNQYAPAFSGDVENDTAGVDGVDSGLENGIEGYYSLNGSRVERPERGVYIVRYNDGTTAKKVFK